MVFVHLTCVHVLVQYSNITNYGYNERVTLVPGKFATNWVN